VRDFESCIQLFEQCQSTLPGVVADDLGVTVVLPRLQVEIDNWDPRTDKMPLHIWIHPWLPILGKKLNVLWTPIRYKLSACLEQWDPRDHSARAVLKPWQQVFDPANWESLLEKVLLKLERAIAETPVQPNGQDTQPVEDLPAWLDIVPVALIARVLETSLFPQWNAALRKWMRSPECDFNEVLQWYQGWRTLLPETVREQGLVQKQLARGLELMKSLMSGDAASADEDGEEDEEQPSAPQGGAQTPASSRAPSASNVMPEDVTLSLSDYMADVAGEHGLVFRPKGRTAQLGKQVYQFGSVTVYFDKNLVYAAPKGGGDEWFPVSFDEVLKLALRPAKK
jgi:tuftelin-interacting protein 11